MNPVQNTGHAFWCHLHPLMSEKILSNSLMIKIKGPTLQEFNPDAAIHLWFNKCQRRPGITGSWGNKVDVRLLLLLVQLIKLIKKQKNIWDRLGMKLKMQLARFLQINCFKSQMIVTISWIITVMERMQLKYFTRLLVTEYNEQQYQNI